MNRPETIQRRRLKPEERRTIILDCAAEIVAQDGIAAISIEHIAKQCGISKSLVYNYFPNLTELLQSLLLRELRRLRRQQAEAADSASTFEDLVRSLTHVYLRYIDERGLIIERLRHEPSVSNMHDPTEFSRELAVGHLADLLAESFGLSADVAHAATDISFGLPAAAGAFLLRSNMPLADVEALTTSMIMGSLSHLGSGADIWRKPLPRRARLMD